MLRICISLLVLETMAVAAWGSHISVSGNVSGAWSVDTVLVAGEITLPSGQSLTIIAGTEVIFQGHYQFMVNGALTAAGTASDSIRFSAADPSIGWGGLRLINTTGYSSLDYCVVTHGRAQGAEPDNCGGGLYCDNALPSVSHTTFVDNAAEQSGGGIWITGFAFPYFTDCRFENNQATVGGGAIGIWQASPYISNCLLLNNASSGDGGGLFGYEAGPTIIQCVISRNQATERGGGLCFNWTSNPEIWGCLIDHNRGGDGGGIYARYSSIILRACLLYGNSAEGGAGVFTHNDGGGIALGYDDMGSASVLLIDCTVAQNQAGHHGGGLYCGVDNTTQIFGCRFHANVGQQFGGAIAWYAPGTSTLDRCAITNNHAGALAGGLYNYNYAYNYQRHVSVVNNLSDSAAGGIFVTNGPVTPITSGIFWGNSQQQIGYVSYPSVTYSNIQGGWPGTGNLNSDPLFVDTQYSDYRLAPGSPCMDTGNPDALYNDPDGTRSDMGAFYFDQSAPVRILLTAHQVPYLIPSSGSTMNFTIRVSNWTTAPHTATVWCDVTLPDSSLFGPVIGPLSVTISAGQTLSRVRTQNVPDYAPQGVYSYNAYAVVGSDTSKDSFLFGKLGSGNQIVGLLRDSGFGEWANTGEEFVGGTSANGRIASTLSGSRTTPTTVISPNPFNPSTAIRYQIPDARYVSLKVYDLSGRLVVTLVDGWREAGRHQVIFDGSELAAGVYIYRLEAEGQTASGKMVLLK